MVSLINGGMGCSHEVNKSFNVPPTKRFVRFTFITLLLFSLSIGAFRGYARSAKSVQYLDVTKEAGITFKHVNGRAGKRYMVETMGTGAAFLDYNNDGYLDIYFVNSAALPGGTYDVKPTNVLYRNNGDGTFIDVSLIASVGDTGYGSGCCVGDYDNDGYNDLYVTNFGTNVLYHNNGDGAFVDVTDRAGVGGGDKWSAIARSTVGLLKITNTGFQICPTEPACSVCSICIFMANPSMIGVVDTYGIELIHPRREGPSEQQMDRKGISQRWIVGGKLCLLLDHLGQIVDCDCDTANVYDGHAFQHIVDGVQRGNGRFCR